VNNGCEHLSAGFSCADVIETKTEISLFVLENGDVAIKENVRQKETIKAIIY
jgi:hypothetical protein